MSMSSGTRSLLAEVASWAIVACLCVGVIVHYDTLKALIADAAGLEPVTITAAEDPSAPTALRADYPEGLIVEIKAGQGGHYHAEAEINGRDIEVLVDTGATMVVLTWEDAESAGLYLSDADFTHQASTANGTARVAPVMLDKVSIGDITVRDVRAMVSERNALHVSLLGMSFLGQLDRVDMRSGTMILQN